MLRRSIVVGASLAMLLACATNEATLAKPTGCAEVAGYYDVNVFPAGSDCPGGQSPAKIIMLISEIGGDLYVVLPNAASGCKGIFDEKACRLFARCTIADAGASTFSVDYTFDGTALSGRYTETFDAGIIGANACTMAADHDGEKRPK